MDRKSPSSSRVSGMQIEIQRGSIRSLTGLGESIEDKLQATYAHNIIDITDRYSTSPIYAEPDPLGSEDESLYNEICGNSQGRKRFNSKGKQAPKTLPRPNTKTRPRRQTEPPANENSSSYQSQASELARTFSASSNAVQTFFNSLRRKYYYISIYGSI